MAIGNLVANLGVNSKDFTKGLADAKSSASSFAGSLAKTLGPVAGILAGVWGTASSVSAAKVQLQAEKKLGAVLEATGHAAGLTATEMKGFASELQGVTNFGDEATIESMSLLATFKEIKGVNFKNAIVGIQDMATVMGTDMKGATIQMGKALNDPIKGMTALSRAGVSFTEQQKEQIRTMQEAGDIAGAQQVILAEIQGEFGGAAKALADPWTQAKNVLGDVSEMFGNLLLPEINVVSGAITWAGTMVTQYGDTFKAIGVEIGAWLSVLGQAWLVYATSLWNVIEPIVSTIADLFQWLFGDIIGEGGLSFQEMGIEALVVMTNITGIIELAAMQWGLYFVEFGNDVAFWLTDKLPAYAMWFADNFTDIMFTAVDYAATIFINLGQNIRNMWSAVWEFIKGNGFEFDWTPLTEGAASAIKSLPDIPERVATQFEKSMQSDITNLTEGLGQSMDKQRAELTAGLKKSREDTAKTFKTDTKIPTMGEGGDGTPDAIATAGKGKSAAAAQDYGSAAAYSTIAAAFINKGKDPTVSAIEKQTEELKKSAKENKDEVVVVESFGD